MIQNRLKILISAYACSPILGSEAGVGWGFVFEISKYHDVYVITQYDKFRESILESSKIHPHLSNIKFFGVNRVRNFIVEKIWPPSYYLTYKKWQKDAFVLAKELDKKFDFDIVHQLNMIGFREPGYLWKLGKPFVWGPIGGMGLFPWRFLSTLGVYGFVYHLSYNVINLIHVSLLKRPKKAISIPKMIPIAANLENQSWIKRYYKVNSEIIFPVGPPIFPIFPIENKDSEIISIVWSGLHISRKSLNLGLKALALLPKNLKWKLNILGIGALTNKWIKLSKSLNIYDNCVFHGELSRDLALNIMNSADIHLFTSLREGTPTVIVEGFSCGLPTICFDVSGMRDMVDSSCGIKVKLESVDKTILNLSESISLLIRDKELRFSLSKGAYDRLSYFQWDKKIESLFSLYQKLL